MEGRHIAPRPDYGGACLSEVVPAILTRHERARRGTLQGWFPPALADARQVLLLVLDGLGHDQLNDHRELAPVLASLSGGPITSVAPTTTATALTSIVTGTTPAEHGILGYRMRAGGEVLNVLRWTTPGGDARGRIDPHELQGRPAFGGGDPPVITRVEFAGSGFTEAQMHGARLVGWRVESEIVVAARTALRAGEPFVYAYYDGVDKVAHEHGVGEHYAAELTFVDRLVGDLLEALPPGAALAVTADHGQVEVGDAIVSLDRDLVALVSSMSGEGRFRWLHASAGAGADLAAACAERYGELAWVLSRAQLCEGGYFGGRPPECFAARLGDVALVARAPVAFADPADPGERSLVARHGSLTASELLVPFLSGSR